ncbi:hypothetical protein G8A07_20355 [Roseateles sp. DAIF2]|uniref:translocation/assembly module TamB domain-containing protein n=1 Tax=Roseateles sp. DAIF2 TaxID=2714952 RepID=UPI0018A2C4D6|nr:translocation/assembly module TamB domain-containing protein [Roseateles sp. DAIF2]QPF75035.1 hypothetical protein G8A07_20355 [Roseateles sp. DAIF2]
MTDKAPPEQKPASPRRRRLRRWLAGSLALPALAALGVLGLYWGSSTESGSIWALERIPGLSLEAPSGNLLGGFSARRLSFRAEGFSLELQGLRWQGLSLAWDSSPALWGRLRVKELAVDKALLDWSSSDQPASGPPQDLTLPLALELPSLAVGELIAKPLSATPLRGLQGGVWLGEDGGARHRVELRRLAWERLNLAGQATLQTRGEMRVAAKLQLTQDAATDAALPELRGWSAEARLDGPLAGPRLLAEASLPAAPERAGQRLKLDAGLAPFAPWPLAQARLTTENFDLQALVASLPATALSGSAKLDGSAWDRPARLQAELANARAGRWDQQRLPLQRLDLDLQLRPDRLAGLADPKGLAELQVQRLELLLGSVREPGGRLSASGNGLKLQARLAALRSAALDERLPKLELGGGLDLVGRPAAGGALALQLETRLDGRFMPDGKTARPLALQLSARHEGQVLHLERAELRSGASQLNLQGQVVPGGTAGWSARFSAAAREFDPRLVWAGPPRSAWALGQHSLDASLSGELRQGRGPWPAGQAELKLAPSLLAGVGLNGQLLYQAAAGAAPRLTAELQAGENRLKLQAEELGAKLPQGRLALEAPRLAALTPLLAATLPPGSKELQLGGSAQAQLELALDGEELRSSGKLNARALQLRGLPGLTAPLSLAEADLGWQLDSRPEAPLRAEGRLERLAYGPSQLSQGLLDLQGSWARHRLKLELQGQLPTPDWAATVADGPTLAGSLRTALAGQLNESPWRSLVKGRAPLDWRAQLEQLQLRPQKRGQPDWLAARELALRLNLGSGGELLAAEAAPGKLELAGATIAWRQLSWQAPRLLGRPPQVLADVSLEPLKVAPLLARWQPDFGWGGELVVGGSAKIRSAPRVEVDIVLERAGGDLSVTEGSSVQQLGLSDLRLALQARDGVWHFAQGVAGSNLGVMGGAISSRTSAQALWPGPEAPLEGVLQLDVANLGTWGAWVPAGWRLGGTFNAALQLAGKVGAPEILGRARGAQLQLRNPLLGVDARDGELALDLNGPTATLQRFAVRGSAGGQLTAQGRAEFGAKPQLDLQLKADKFTFLGRVDRRLVASGQAGLQIVERSLSLNGRVEVDEGLFDFSRGNAPTLDDDVQVIRAVDPAEADKATPRASKGPAPKIDVQVAIDLGRQLRLRGRGVDTRLRGELRLIHQGAGPLLTGTVSTFGGTYDAYGQKLEIEKGEVSFAGAIDNPRINVLAVRPNTDLRVGVTVTGTALDPRIKLFSEPEKSDTEKLSWLLLGRAPDGLGRADTALLQRAALALLSGEGESPSGKLIKNLGLDELSVSQEDSDARGTVVRLGKQLSRHWYVGYERGLNATAGSWQLIYRLAQRFTLRAQTGQDNAVDLIWQWKWD